MHNHTDLPRWQTQITLVQLLLGLFQKRSMLSTWRKLKIPPLSLFGHPTYLPFQGYLGFQSHTSPWTSIIQFILGMTQELRKGCLCIDMVRFSCLFGIISHRLQHHSNPQNSTIFASTNNCQNLSMIFEFAEGIFLLRHTIKPPFLQQLLQHNWKVLIVLPCVHFKRMV